MWGIGINHVQFNLATFGEDPVTFCYSQFVDPDLAMTICRLLSYQFYMSPAHPTLSLGYCREAAGASQIPANMASNFPTTMSRDFTREESRRSKLPSALQLSSLRNIPAMCAVSHWNRKSPPRFICKGLKQSGCPCCDWHIEPKHRV